MAKIRVYELAKDLNMTNKAFLTKIEKMGISVGSHMSSLDDETVELIKSNLFGKKEPDSDVEVKRVRSTVIRRRKKASDMYDSSEDLSDYDDDESDDEHEQRVVDDEADDIPEADEHQDRGPHHAKDGDVPVKHPKTQPSVVVTKKTAFEAAKIVKRPPVKIVVPDEPEFEESASQEPDVDDQISLDSVSEEPVDQNEEAADSADILDGESAGDLSDSDDDSKSDLKKKKKKKFTAARIIKLPDPPSITAIKAPKIEEVFSLVKETIPVVPIIVDDEKTAEKAFKKAKKSKVFVAEDETESEFFSKKKAKRKTVVEGNALYSSGHGRKGRKAAKGSKVKVDEGLKTQITTPKAIKRRIKIDDTIILAELAKRMGIKASEMIAKLMGLGVMVTVNQTIDYDTAVLVASEFGFEVERASFEEDIFLKPESVDEPESLMHRPPVVTIMGHVDHGKTSLLDVIRTSSIADGDIYGHASPWCKSHGPGCSCCGCR
jgi:translation initiation factor IF-2